MGRGEGRVEILVLLPRLASWDPDLASVHQAWVLTLACGQPAPAS